MKENKFTNTVRVFLDKNLHLKPNDLAKSYLKLFIDFNSPMFYGELEVSNPLKEKLTSLGDPLGSNIIALSSDDKSFEHLTKRVPLIMEHTVFGHSNGNSLIDTKEIIDPLNSEHLSAYAQVPDLDFLGKWLKQTHPLLKSGVVSYVPNNIKVINSTHEYGGGPKEYIENYSYGPDMIINERIVGEVHNKKLVINKYVKPIITVDLPFIDGVALDTYGKIMIDEQNSLSVLRNYLKECLLEINSKEGSEDYFTSLEKFKIQINKGVNSISNDIRALNTKRIFSISGATITSLAATLVAINSELFENWLNILGTSGGAFLFHKLFESHNTDKRKIKESPFYYLWMLHDKTK